MTTDIIEINNFIVLIEQSNAAIPIIERCEIDNGIIGFAFYGSGDVELEITYQQQQKTIHNTAGIAMSFYGNNKVEFAHKISPKRSLQSISVFAKLDKLQELPPLEIDFFSKHLLHLINPEIDFVEGPKFFMPIDMQRIVKKIHQNQFQGAARLMFLKSQITELLAHFFSQLETQVEQPLKKEDLNKLYLAKEIMSQNMASPPSLKELSKRIGLNNNKLKKNFKELFGIPVFKYLQHERLMKAHELLSNGTSNIQETAWFVGYESLSSFSNAFQKKFGYRPSQIKK